MLRLTMVEEPAPPPPETPEAARAAAIAAMGYRLAAAGPRTRRRLLDRQVEPEDPAEVIFTISPAMLRRLAVLGTAAACSFGLVLAAQGRDWSFLHSNTVNSDIIAQTERPPPAAKPEFLALADPPTLTAAPTLVADHPQKLAVADPPTAPKMLPGPEAQARSKTPAKPAARDMAQAAHPAPRQVASKAEPVAPRLAEATSHAPHSAAVAHYELPRWLTDYHPEHKRVLVMSEPPHDLTPPPGAEYHASAPVTAPQPAPAPARLQYASVAPAPRPMPALRQPYGYGYGYGYGGPYAYGPVYYPYAPPPPYYSGHW